MVKKVREIYIPSVILLFFGAYMLGRVYGVPFVENFWAGLFATFIGVVLGIPIAFHIHGVQERYRGDLEKIEEEKRKRIILLALRKELEKNRDMLMEYKKNFKDTSTSEILILVIRDETWRAFSDGGELEWIKDIELLEDLANVYFIIRTISISSERLHDYCIARIRQSIESQRSELIDGIGKAYNTINELCKELPQSS